MADHRPPLKLKFVDFWDVFDTQDNYFTGLLSPYFDIQISDSPEVLIYSSFGHEHSRYDRALKIYFTGENLRPNPWECDHFLSFDYPSSSRDLRWPLYNLYPRTELAFGERQKFCCMVVSNAASRFRLQFFERLSARKPVDSGGKVANNVGGPVADKLKFLSGYRFNLCFENSSFPGYVTEKVFEAKRAGCIPIYWGDALVGNDLNRKALVELSAYPSVDACIEDILAIDANPERYKAMAEEPLFEAGKVYPYSDIKELQAFLVSKIGNRSRRLRSPLFAHLYQAFAGRRTQAVDRLAVSRWST